MKESSNLKNIVTKPNTDLLFGRVLPANRVLVIAPHCDDEILGFGGNIIKYSEQAQVKIIFLTCDKELKRKEEAQNAWKENANVTLEFLEIEDSCLNQQDVLAADRVSQLIRKFQPEVIAVPWHLDKHSDHVYSNIILAKALQKLKAEEMQNTGNIVSYEVNFPLCMNYSVNITDVFDKKIGILMNYKSQKPDKLAVTIEFLNSYRASQMPLRKVKKAEGLYVCTPKEYCEMLKLHICYEGRENNEEFGD